MLAVGRGEEPLQRRPRPVRPLPERDHRRRRARVAAGVPPAAPARLLPADRRRRRGAARERRHAPSEFTDKPGVRRRLRRRDRPPVPAREVDASPRSRPRRWPPQRAYAMAGVEPVADRLRRGARLLHDHRDPRHRGPRLRRQGQGRRRVARGRDVARPAASRSTRPAGCSPRATRSARPASRRSPSAGGSCAARPSERQVEMRNGYALQHNVGGRGSGVSVVNILTTNRA